MNGNSYFSAFPFVQSEALAGSGASPDAGGGGGSVEYPSLSPSSSCSGASPDAGGGGGSVEYPSLSPSSACSGASPDAGGGGGGALGWAQELYPYASGQTESAITRSGTPNTDSSGWRAFAFVSQSNQTINRMAVAIRNTGGLFMRLGVFDVNGHLLAKTVRFTPISNSIVVVSLDAPVPLMGAGGYYMGFWSDDVTGNLQFSVETGRSVSTRTPLMQRSDPNEGATTISSAFPNTPLRPWLMVME